MILVQTQKEAHYSTNMLPRIGTSDINHNYRLDNIDKICRQKDQDISETVILSNNDRTIHRVSQKITPIV